MTSHGSRKTRHTAQMMTSHRAGTSIHQRDRTRQRADYEADNAVAMLRCVVAAESYRLPAQAGGVRLLTGGAGRSPA